MSAEQAAGGIIRISEKQPLGTCFVFKHSTRCPVSTRASEEVKQATWNEPLYWIDVVEQRELSNWVASELGVTHESPQLIRVENGKPVKVWNHHQIRKESFSA